LVLKTSPAWSDEKDRSWTPALCSSSGAEFVVFFIPRPMTNEQELRLAAPGAGLPWPELIFGRVLFRAMRLAWSRETALRRFVQQARVITELLQGISDDVGSRRVLVPRLMGLEDSSRFWSPFMIAQHLFIVNRDTLVIIEALCAGQVPAGEVRIAGIKPRPDADRSAVTDFETIVATVERRLPQITGWPGAGGHRHPWFGPLNAHGWLCLMAMHHGIHQRQLERVLQSSNTPDSNSQP
jgi:hypothetical protein